MIKNKSGVYKTGENIDICFDLHDISARLHKFSNLYDNLEKLPSLVPILIKSLYYTREENNLKEFDISVNIPIINANYNLHASSVLDHVNDNEFIIQGSASGDLHLNACAVFYSDNLYTTNCISSFEIESFTSTWSLYILRLAFSFVNSIAPMLMAYAANNQSL